MECLSNDGGLEEIIGTLGIKEPQYLQKLIEKAFVVDWMFDFGIWSV